MLGSSVYPKEVLKASQVWGIPVPRIKAGALAYVSTTVATEVKGLGLRWMIFWTLDPQATLTGLLWGSL